MSRPHRIELRGARRFTPKVLRPWLYVIAGGESLVSHTGTQLRTTDADGMRVTGLPQQHHTVGGPSRQLADLDSGTAATAASRPHLGRDHRARRRPARLMRPPRPARHHRDLRTERLRLRILAPSPEGSSAPHISGGSCTSTPTGPGPPRSLHHARPTRRARRPLTSPPPNPTTMTRSTGHTQGQRPRTPHQTARVEQHQQPPKITARPLRKIEASVSSRRHAAPRELPGPPWGSQQEP